jgi:large subunit ribosomal protein L31
MHHYFAYTSGFAILVSGIYSRPLFLLGTAQKGLQRLRYALLEVFWTSARPAKKLFIMKKDIHPAYNEVVFLDTSSDFKFLTRSTMSAKDTIQWEDGKEYPLIKVEISSASHPFYTGKKIFVDTAGRVEKFRQKYGRKSTEKE